MGRIERLGVLLAGALLLGWSGAARAAGQDASRPVPAPYVLDLMALKDGAAVRDLSAGELELAVDGRRVPLGSLSYVEAPQGRRLVVIFHDMNLWIRNVQRDRDDITDGLLGLAADGIAMMVLRLASPGGLRVVQDFTRDPSLIRRAAEAAMTKEGMSESFEDLNERIVPTTGMEGFDRSEGRNRLASFYDLKRVRFEKTVGGLIAASSLLRALPGRKSVLLISGGIPDISSPSRTAIMESIEDSRTAKPEEPSRATLDAIHERGQRMTLRTRVFDPLGLLKGERFERGDQVLARLAEFFNTSNISVHALDPGVFTKSAHQLTADMARPPKGSDSESLQSEDRAREVQSLRELAEDTGGRLFRGANKLEELRARLEAELDGAYELAFRASNGAPDGKFHKLRVRTHRKGVELSVRNGYRSLRAEDERALRLLSALYAPELFREVPFEARLVPFVAGSGRPSSWILLSVAGGSGLARRLGTSPSGPDLPLYAWLRDRGAGDKGFATRLAVPVPPDAASPDPRSGEIRLSIEGPALEAAGEVYDAVLLLQDPVTGEIGGWSAPVAVAGVGRKDVPAVVGFVAGAAVEGAPAGGGHDGAVLDPKNGSVRIGETTFVPRASGRFTAGEDAWIFLQAHLPRREGNAPLVPAFTVRATGPGATPRAVEGVSVAGSWNAKAGVWSGLFRFALAGLPEGAYVLTAAFPGRDEVVGELKLFLAGNEPPSER